MPSGRREAREGFFGAAAEVLSDRTTRKRLARFATHPVGLLAIATIFATVAGAWLTNYYQHQAWIRQKDFETFKYGFDQSLALVDELTEAASRRLFGLNRVLWVAKGTGTGDLETVWNEYYDSVVDWNVKLAQRKGKLERFVSPAAAELWLTDADAALSYSEGTPESIHGHFMVAHQRVRAAADCVRKRCDEHERRTAFKSAEQELNLLGLAVDGFLRSCTDDIFNSSS